MSKPSAASIRSAAPLSSKRWDRKPLEHCQVCGQKADPVLLQIWRECDERDKPIAGTDALVFIAADHKECQREMRAHPRLYVREMGLPGSWPNLCARCVHRYELSCTHPDLKANGGEGLHVKLAGLSAIICTRGAGCHKPVARAEECAGFQLLKVVQ